MGPAGLLALGALLGLLVAGFATPSLMLTLALVSAGCALLVGAARMPALAAISSVPFGAALAIGLATTHPLGPVVDGRIGLSGRVISAGVGGMADVHAHRMRDPSTGQVHAGRVRVQFTGRAPPPGTEVLLAGMAGPPSSQALPGSPDLALGTWLSGIRTEVEAQHWHRIDAEAPFPLPPGRHGGVLHALAWGDRTHLDPDLVARMRRTGTAHLLAISGFHVGLVAGAIGGLLRIICRSLAFASPRGAPTRWVWLVGGVIAWVYAHAAGAPIGALRSAWVLTGIAALSCLGLKVRGLDLLFVAAAAIAVADPAALTTPGFHLSFGAVLGLLRLTPQLDALRPRGWPTLLRPVWTSASASVAATLGTLPASGWWFQTLAWTSPVSNLIAGPVVSFMLVPLAAIHCMGLSFLDPWIGLATDAVCEGLMWALYVVDLPPWPIALGPLSAALLACAVLVNQRHVWILAFLVVIAPGVPPPRAGVRVLFADVGAGAATLVEWPDGRRWLIDGGPRAEAVLHWLRRRGVQRLDVVAASSGRAPRSGGLAAVVDAIPVGEVWIPPGSRSDPDLRDFVGAAVERGIPVIPDPPANLAADARAWLRDEGDRSLVLMVGTPGGPQLLLTGDLGARGARAVAAAVPTPAVLVMPRHGARVSGGPAAWPTAPPAMLIEAGRPAEAVMTAWGRTGAPVWRTDRDGSVEITLRDHSVSIRTWRWDHGWRQGPRVRSRVTPWIQAGGIARGLAQHAPEPMR